MQSDEDAERRTGERRAAPTAAMQRRVARLEQQALARLGRGGLRRQASTACGVLRRYHR
jgi:hypothetical protein